jgi:hypothetical protein
MTTDRSEKLTPDASPIVATTTRSFPCFAKGSTTFERTA